MIWLRKLLLKCQHQRTINLLKDPEYYSRGKFTNNIGPG